MKGSWQTAISGRETFCFPKSAFKGKEEIIKGITKQIHFFLRTALSGFNWKDKNEG